MLIICDAASLARALDSPLDPDLSRLLTLRRNDLGDDIEGVGHFIIVEAGDSVDVVEAAIGFPLTMEGEPCFEWLADHGDLFELTFILSDDGPAQVVLVLDRNDMDASVIGLCRLHNRMALNVEQPERP